MIDRSKFVRSENFQDLLDFAKDIVGDLEVRPTKTRVGVVAYARDADIQFPLDMYTTQQDVMDAIGRIEYMDGQTDIVNALNTIQNQMFTVSSGNRRKKLILLTERLNNDMRGDSELIRVATELKLVGVEITTVSFGRMTNRQALRAICSSSYNTATKTTEYQMYEISDYTESEQYANEIVSGPLCDEYGKMI